MKYFLINIVLYLSIQSVTKAQSYNTVNPTSFSTVSRIDHSGNQYILSNAGRAFYPGMNDTTIKNAAYYFAKSKHQNSTAWTLAIAGTVFIGAAILVGNGKEKSNTGSWNFGPSNKEVWTGIFGVVGGSLVIASIPCFITSGVYKHKARVAIKSQNAGFGIPKGTSDIQGFSLEFPIGR